MTALGVDPAAGQCCSQAHYVTIVDSSKATEIYQRGEIDCANCLRSMATKHAELAEIFRDKLFALGGSR